MRPEILFPLFAPVASLPGVGPHVAKLIEKAAGPHVADLLWALPVSVIDRRSVACLAEARIGEVTTLSVTTTEIEAPQGPKRPWRALCQDSEGEWLELIFFHAKGDMLRRSLPIGEARLISGLLEEWRGQRKMTHPEVIKPEDAGRAEGPEPVRPLTAGLSGKVLAKAVAQALKRAPETPEWIDPHLLKREGWPSWREALAAAHAPRSAAELAPTTPIRRRLAYDEIFANQLALALVRAKRRTLPGISRKGDGRLVEPLLRALPYALTGAQRQAFAEIAGDMGSERRMLRLLQGDVGSGKTVVALLAAALAAECGGQSAIMAPTEILARQHLETIQPLAELIGLRVASLTGRDKGKARAALLERLAGGEIDLIIGTHALFQEDVVFADLALAVIDEQHRFGVHQRLTLAKKGRGVDMLVMTATPIPRTLVMSLYGDLDASRLWEKPPGRKPVTTRALPLDRLDEVAAGIGRALDGGAQVYWVCPLVEESEQLDLTAAQDRFVHLAELFGADRVALVHGKLTPSAKDQAMARFASGDARLLVATTVIEVGVNVPNATIMVIEQAERFGLAQLHQLRGRIGRGDQASSCLLLYKSPLNETAKARLEVMRATEDGFLIAEEDLRLRGAGEILGLKQSGVPNFRLADAAACADLIEIARDDARLTLDRDPDLETPRGQALRVLLYLFERDAAARLLRSG